MFGIGPMELLLIFVVALLVFGPKRLPELARTLGRGLAEFRRASNDLRQSLALDELQQDLRHDLTGHQTIHRPGDRPAQAGDGAPTKTGEDGGPTADPAPGARAGDAGPPNHPGQLPLGNDHEHHDPEPESESEEFVGTTSPGAPAADVSASAKTATADPDLGSVPVSGSKPSDPTRG
ncbi:MAG TPA: twin-arginine translocase TatA/TatE family subunit [Deltaproteobacteria bacterium]|nr:twin-arginine translocase TatA/TatE family subunit [Deltaproteobacteria bacterium]